MEQERVDLTAHELRVLADVESTFRREDPELDRTLGRVRPPRSGAVAVLAATVGSILIAAGLIAEVIVEGVHWAATVVAFSGFILVLAGVHALVREWRAASGWRRLRVTLGLDTATPPDASTGRS